MVAVGKARPEAKLVIYETASGRKFFYKNIKPKEDNNMATKLKYDAVVVTGQYQDSTGATKNRSMNVGSVLERDDGSLFFVLNRTFNAAGVPNPENRDTLIVNFYEPKAKNLAAPSAQRAPISPPPNGTFNPADDDEPF